MEPGLVAWRTIAEGAERRLSESRARGGSTIDPDADLGLWARWITAEAAGIEDAAWLAERSEPATVGGVRRVDAMVERLADGEPLQYVLGHWPFRHLDLMVDGRVLIPRPETEGLVELVLKHLRALGLASPTVLDLGTGSGAIGLSLAVERPGSSVLLTDSSTDALAVARANLAGLGMAARGVTLAEGDWFDSAEIVGRRFDVIVSNPPYVDRADALEPHVERWEPTSALFADESGTADLATIIDGAPAQLAPGGLLALEMDSRQAEWSAERAARWADRVVVETDLAGRDRYLLAWVD